MRRMLDRLSMVCCASLCIVCLAFAWQELGLHIPLEAGLDFGDVTYLQENWVCTPQGGDTFPVTLPETLPLPSGTQSLTLATTLPDTVRDGDVLRFHTLMGWYRIFINGELRASHGSDVLTEKYTLENGSTMILVKLRTQDAGAMLTVETGYQYTHYLAQQKAPTFSNHRDLLMQDLVGSSTNVLVSVFLFALAILLGLLWFIFWCKGQSWSYLLMGSVFVFLGAVYYNIGNTLRVELWGYPSSIAMYGDFAYYFLQFFLPVAGYHMVMRSTDKRLSKGFHGFVLAHTLFASAVMVLQMLWMANLDVSEHIGIALILVGYGWCWRELRPLSRPVAQRRVLLPVFGCILGFLMDYYKLAGTWWPIPDSWVSFLQTGLPFMCFFPLALCVLAPSILWALVEHLVQEQVSLEKSQETAQLQAQLAEREYRESLSNIGELRKLRHDINHHLRALHALATQAGNQEGCAYIEEVMAEIPSHVLGSPNFVTDSFLEHYRVQCQGFGIGFFADIRYDENKLVTKNQLGILLGNALKNACEAAANPGIKNPFVRIRAYEKGLQIVLIIENSYFGQVHPGYKSTKGKDRGFGLDSIRGATTQSGGYLHLSQQNQVFTLKAVLPCGEPPQGD